MLLKQTNKIPRKTKKHANFCKIFAVDSWCCSLFIGFAFDVNTPDQPGSSLFVKTFSFRENPKHLLSIAQTARRIDFATHPLCRIIQTSQSRSGGFLRPLIHMLIDSPMSIISILSSSLTSLKFCCGNFALVRATLIF